MEDNIWFIIYNDDVLYRISLSDNVVYYEMGITKDEMLHGVWNNLICIDSNTIAIISSNINKVYIYTIDDHAVKIINLCEYLNMNECATTMASFLYNDKLCIILTANEPLVMIDINTLDIELDYDFMENIRNKIIRDTQGKHIQVIGDFIYFISGGNSFIYKYDLFHRKGDVIDLEKDMDLGGNILIDEDKIWFYQRGCFGIYRYNIDNESIDYFENNLVSDSEIFTTKNLQLYQKLEKYKNYIWLVPMNTRSLYRFNIVDKKFELITTFENNKCTFDNKKWFSVACCVYKEKLFIMPFEYDRVVVVNLESEAIFEMPIRDINMMDFRTEQIMRESAIMNLESLIKMFA